MYRSNLSLIVSHIEIAVRLESILWLWRKIKLTWCPSLVHVEQGEQHCERALDIPHLPGESVSSSSKTEFGRLHIWLRYFREMAFKYNFVRSFHSFQWEYLHYITTESTVTTSEQKTLSFDITWILCLKWKGSKVNLIIFITSQFSVFSQPCINTGKVQVKNIYSKDNLYNCQGKIEKSCGTNYAAYKTTDIRGKMHGDDWEDGFL